MTLRSGTRLGPYEVVAPLGAGGMGEVYRARDMTLNRDVALKVLPAAFSEDADRLARFKREAQVLAALNHPQIASIYGFETSGATQCLVLELVDGQTLADRLTRGPLAIDEAVRIARQIADALEAAHEKGIIHRDLKPANIALDANDQVKVLDFGLAKLTAGSGGPGSSGYDLAASPTITTPAMLNGAGTILGTAAYMAPEQAKGREADKRSDLWSFGCVLYEMLTGKQAFDGEDVLDLLTAVMRSEPDWSALPAGTPANVRTVLERCLKKDRRQRVADIAVVQFLLDAPPPVDSPTLSTTDSRLPTRSGALPWAVAGAAVVLAGALLMLWSPWRSAPMPTPRTLVALNGADAPLRTDPGASNIALSPDGTTLAFVAQSTGDRRLFVRKLDQLQASALAGTENANNPFFSPDGQWIAFFAESSLKKIPVTGGAVVKLSDGISSRGGTWTDEDTIIFTRTSNGPNTTSLMRVPAAGGTPAAFGTLSAGATTQRWPQALPGGKGVLYTEHSAADGFDGANVVIAPLSGGTPKVVVRGGYFGRYVPSGHGSPTRGERAGGHVIFVRKGALLAVRVDLDRLEAIGEAVPAVEGVAANSEASGAHLAVSREGTLVYLHAAFATAGYPIHWMSRDGSSSVLRATRADWANPRFSPDGKKLAMDIFDGKQYDIWVYEWARDTLTQLTFDAGSDRSPVWTPDGRRIVFGSDRAQRGVPNMYWVNADGSGEVTRLRESPESENPSSWHPSGKFLTYTLRAGSGKADSMLLPMEGDAVRGWTPGKPYALLNKPANAENSMFSTDGRWIAYTLTERTTNAAVYVRPFPGPGGPWRIDAEGGTSPDWWASGHELLFLNPKTSTIMFVNYTVAGDSFRADKPQAWQSASVMSLSITARRFAIHPDGTRLALVARDPSVVQDKLVFVFNFADQLRRLTATTR